MKSGSKKSGSSWRNCRIGRGVWICIAAACGLLLVNLSHRRAAENVFPPRVLSTSGLPGCLQCNLDMAKFPQDVARKTSPGRSGRSQGKDVYQQLGRFLLEEEKFMYYAPHSGFSNQVMELKNALVFAKLLNRTLIIPPVLEHHAAWLGSCPKRRVLAPHRLRALVWTRISELILNSSGRYTPLTDIVDLSAISPSKVKTIDLRIFLALWCGVDVKASCGGPLCKAFAEKIPVWGVFKTCVDVLNPSSMQAEQQCCVYGVEDDCTSTIWRIMMNSHNDGNNGSAELHIENLSQDGVDVDRPHAARQRHLLLDSAEERSNVWKMEKKKVGRVKESDIMTSLGPDSPAGRFPVLAFGSMFSTNYKGAPTYIDLKFPSGDEELDAFCHALKLLTFTSDIVAAGKKYVREVIGSPFYCAQLRLLDGQFKNHWEKTFRNLKSQLSSIVGARRQRDSIPVFVMTDLPSENWTGTVLQELRDSKTLYHVHKLASVDERIQVASRGIWEAESGFQVGGYGSHLARVETGRQATFSSPETASLHVVLAVEEVVCSCASLGFSGTVGSTIADSVRDLRAANVCIDLGPDLIPPRQKLRALLL